MLRDNEMPPDGGEPMFDMDFEQRLEIAKELGDVLWYAHRCVQRPGLRPR